MLHERIPAADAFFIKLGRKGEWERECLKNGILRFGYQETCHDDCLAGRWDNVRNFWITLRGDRKSATRDTNQIRIFYEAGEKSIFITFHGGLLYWCRARSGVILNTDGTRIRKTIDGWHNTSILGESLRTDRLSGSLLRVQGYRGTICKVANTSYLLRRINGELPESVAAADEARATYLNSIGSMIGLLTWQDFELLVDLIFTNSGWRRLGSLGKTQKSLDLELQLPTTGEIAFVQVKSEASPTVLQDYLKQYQAQERYDRLFFVWHTGAINQLVTEPGVVLLDRMRLAELVLETGLAGWLRDKVS